MIRAQDSGWRLHVANSHGGGDPGARAAHTARCSRPHMCDEELACAAWRRFARLRGLRGYFGYFGYKCAVGPRLVAGCQDWRGRNGALYMNTVAGPPGWTIVVPFCPKGTQLRGAATAESKLPMAPSLTLQVRTSPACRPHCLGPTCIRRKKKTTGLQAASCSAAQPGFGYSCVPLTGSTPCSLASPRRNNSPGRSMFSPLSSRGTRRAPWIPRRWPRLRS